MSSLPKALAGPVLHPEAQLVALDAQRSMVTHRSGGALLEASSEAIFAILGSLDGSPLSQSLALLRPQLQRFAPRLVDQLGPEICTTESPAELSLRVAVVGNGPWAHRVHRRLDEVFPGLGTLHEIPSEELDDRPRLPPERLARWAPPQAQIEALFSGYDLIIAAPEGVTGAALRPFNQAALRSTRGRLLPALPEPIGICLGPLVEPGRALCWFCHRLSLLGAQEAPLADLSAACDHLAIPPVARRTAREQERALAALVEEVGSLAERRIPATVCDVLVFPSRGRPRATRVYPTTSCPDCASVAPIRRHAEEFRWPAELPAPAPLSAAPGAPWGQSERRRRATRWLLALGEANTAGLPHAVSTFLSHLQGTWEILDGWGQPEELCCAGLFHSVYGSDVFDRPTFSGSERAPLQALLGEETERLIYLFCTLDRTRFATAIARQEEIPDRGVEVWNWRTGERGWLTAEDAARLLVVETANIAEQSHPGDLSPALWVAEAALAGRVLARRGLVLPPFRDNQTLTTEQEERSLAAYRAAIEASASDRQSAEAAALESARLNPFVGEPWLLAASLSVDRSVACERAQQGLRRLHRWLTPWDKRAPLGAWLAWGQQIIDQNR